MVKGKKWVLAKRINGEPNFGDFSLVEEDVQCPEGGKCFFFKFRFYNIFNSSNYL